MFQEWTEKQSTKASKKLAKRKFEEWKCDEVEEWTNEWNQERMKGTSLSSLDGMD